eukprot:10085168-Alexandrium_andersonii.AAC.1
MELACEGGHPSSLARTTSGAGQTHSSPSRLAGGPRAGRAASRMAASSAWHSAARASLASWSSASP